MAEQDRRVKGHTWGVEDPLHESRSSADSRGGGLLAPSGSAAIEGPVSLLERVEGYRPRGLVAGDSGRDPASSAPDEAMAIDAAIPAFGRLATTEGVIAGDDRHPVPRHAEAPWSQVCMLRIEAAHGGTYVATGWLAGPRAVITAGHSVFLHEAGGWVRQIEVIPGLSMDQRPFGSATASEYRAPVGWTSERNSDYDYGCIMLPDSRLGDAAGWLSFDTYDDTALLAADVNIAGYSADRQRAMQQHYCARRIVRESPRRLYFDTDVYGRQSGAPVWVRTADERRVVVGMQTSGALTSNFAARLVRDAVVNMRSWKNEA